MWMAVSTIRVESTRQQIWGAASGSAPLDVLRATRPTQLVMRDTFNTFLGTRRGYDQDAGAQVGSATLLCHAQFQTLRALMG